MKRLAILISDWSGTALLSAFMVYLSVGVLFGTYEWDEIYYLFSGWADYNNQAEYVITPFMFHDLLRLPWSWWDGDISLAWQLRIFLLVFVLLQGIIIYQLTGLVFPDTWELKLQLRLLAGILFVTVMTAFRGFEVRPEVLANTIFLFSGYVVLRLVALPRLDHIDRLLVLIACIGLVIASALSLRVLLPAGVLVAVLAALLSMAHGERLWAAIIVFFVMVLVIFIHGIEYNLLKIIGNASAIQSQRQAFSLPERLSIGGSRLHIWLLGIFLISWLTALVSWLSLVRPVGNRRSLLVVLAIFICYALFMLFLAIFDIRPFEYVRSIEWLILVLGFFSLLQALLADAHLARLLGPSVVVMAGVLGAITYDAMHTLEQYKPTRGILGGLWHSLSREQIRVLSDDKLVQVMVDRRSIFNQIWGRSEYCERYPTGWAMVNDWRDHPICMPDETGRIEMGNRAYTKNTFDPTQYQLISLPANDNRDLSGLGFDKIAEVKDRNIWTKRAFSIAP